MGWMVVWWVATAGAAPADVDAGVDVGPPPPPVDLPAPQGVVNGTDAVPGEYGEVVVLVVVYPPYVFPFCSGTVIDPLWVLTAGHCLAGFEPYVASGDVAVVLDANVFAPDDPPNLAAVFADEAIVHPEYDPSDFLASHDVGLLRLETTITGVEPAVLNDEAPGTSWYGDELTFVGYGATDDSQVGTGLRRYAAMPVVGVDPLLLYAFDDSDPHQNLCSGDSGGAAFETTAAGIELAGVNSFVFAYGADDALCAEGGTAAARVDIHVEWIQGFVPDVLVEPIGGDPDTGLPPPPEDTDTGAPGMAIVDPPDWGEPHRPVEDRYPRVCGCNTSGGGVAPAGGGDRSGCGGIPVQRQQVFLLAAGLALWLTRRADRPYARHLIVGGSMSRSTATAVLHTALAGLLAGTLAACGAKAPKEAEVAPPAEAAAPAAEAAPATEAAAPAAAAAAEGAVTASTAAEGAQAATPAAHECKGLNECKGQGGCAVEGQNTCKGQNPCKGMGGCKHT